MGRITRILSCLAVVTAIVMCAAPARAQADRLLETL